MSKERLSFAQNANPQSFETFEASKSIALSVHALDSGFLNSIGVVQESTQLGSQVLGASWTVSDHQQVIEALPAPLAAKLHIRERVLDLLAWGLGDFFVEVTAALPSWLGLLLIT